MVIDRSGVLLLFIVVLCGSLGFLIVLMVLGGSWWVLVVFCDTFWFLVVLFDFFVWFFVILGEPWEGDSYIYPYMDIATIRPIVKMYSPKQVFSKNPFS